MQVAQRGTSSTNNGPMGLLIDLRYNHILEQMNHQHKNKVDVCEWN